MSNYEQTLEINTYVNIIQQIPSLNTKYLL
jgi:hypothetical protein